MLQPLQQLLAVVGRVERCRASRRAEVRIVSNERGQQRAGILRLVRKKILVSYFLPPLLLSVHAVGLDRCFRSLAGFEDVEGVRGEPTRKRGRTWTVSLSGEAGGRKAQGRAVRLKGVVIVWQGGRLLMMLKEIGSLHQRAVFQGRGARERPKVDVCIACTLTERGRGKRGREGERGGDSYSMWLSELIITFSAAVRFLPLRVLGGRCLLNRTNYRRVSIVNLK